MIQDKESIYQLNPSKRLAMQPIFKRLFIQALPHMETKTINPCVKKIHDINSPYRYLKAQTTFKTTESEEV